MVWETCPKSHKLTVADPAKTLRNTPPILHLFPPPELRVPILHEDERKEEEGWTRIGREAWIVRTRIVSALPFQAVLWKPRSIFRTRAQPWQGTPRTLSGQSAAEIGSTLALFTCSLGQPGPYSEWRSTSWGGCSSGLCGRRRAARTMPEGPRSHSLTSGIRAEAFPSQSRTQGSLSSRRVWLLSCTSLQAKKDKKLF